MYYPWHDWNAVLRHNDNNKWYGVVLEVSADKLGLPEAGIVDVLTVRASTAFGTPNAHLLGECPNPLLTVLINHHG